MFLRDDFCQTSLISRHKTAIRRSNISRPIRLAIELGLLNHHSTLFDYGCGYGDDISYLQQLGFDSAGWDPIHHPSVKLKLSDIVNLGYVVNVIEDPGERGRVLQDAWALARKLMIVSARLKIEEPTVETQQSFADGLLTKRGTFQKFYEQHELRDWISEVLGVPPVAVAPGIFFVFRDATELQSFAASAHRRIIHAPRQKLSNAIFERYREFFDTLSAFVANRGRLPDRVEIDGASAIPAEIGSVKRAFSILRQVTGAEQWDQIREARSQDLLVYLALNRFGGRAKFSELSRDLQFDIRAFFSTYRRACDLADKLLFSAGRSDVIDEACRTSPVGKQTPEALYLHVSALPFLPPVLRTYEGCARAYIGVVDGANVVKLNRRKPRVSYLQYHDFDKVPHPRLAASLVVPLQDFKVHYREYDASSNSFVLHRKETMVALDYPYREKFARLTKQEEKLGLYENPQAIGTSTSWEALLSQKGVYHTGHRLLRRKP